MNFSKIKSTWHSAGLFSDWEVKANKKSISIRHKENKKHTRSMQVSGNPDRDNDNLRACKEELMLILEDKEWMGDKFNKFHHQKSKMKK